MADGYVCEVCGNELEQVQTRCPYCGHAHKPSYEKGSFEEYRVVNLEKGMPYVHDALQRLETELKAAKLTGCKVLVLIHGYGSSGRGGAIREAVRDQLRSRIAGKAIREVLPGEDCGKRAGQARQFGKRFPSLKELLQRSNPGMTLVLL